MTHPTQPDVKCPDPKCEHEASEHRGMYEVPGCTHMDDHVFCGCRKNEDEVLRAAYAASEVALAEAQEKAKRDANLLREMRNNEAVAMHGEYMRDLNERDATITFLRGELAEARADYDDVLRERNEARAEVERLREERDADDVKRVFKYAQKFVAERQRLANAICHLLCPRDEMCDPDAKDKCRACRLADRIASGYYATEEVRDED